MFTLKNYQNNALDALDSFLGQARIEGVSKAFANVINDTDNQRPYRPYSFGDVPYVCLRLPTGGGKTVLASHAIRIASQRFLQQDYPIVLWLVPSNTIRKQTVEALKKPGHPYRQELDRTFDNQVKILDIDEVEQIRPQDLEHQAIVVVSTIANLRVNDTSGRQVYAYKEVFEPCFRGVTDPDNKLERVTEEDLKENGLTAAELGKIKFSFANLLALHQPMVVIDEAHNARTHLTFTTLHRIHPACIVELTATPNTTNVSGSNVLYHVSAAQLKAENMIKLPIQLTEHQGWEDAVRDAVLTREKLAIEAQKEHEYLRPIALLQAENANEDVTVEVLKQHLMEEHHIAEEAIAIATGNQRELDGVDLFDANCPVKFVITIQALKEGWDCSFAYVFTTVKSVSSSKDVEQLLGRVLRMPYARRRQSETLNQAYAHIASPSFGAAANQLTDKLVGMGFEEMEIPDLLAPGEGDLFGGQDSVVPPLKQTPKLTIKRSTRPDLSALPAEEKVSIVVEEKPAVGEEPAAYEVKIEGHVSEKAEKALLKGTTGKERKALQKQIVRQNIQVKKAQAPASRGEHFKPLPQLCALIQGEMELLEPEIFLNIHHWSLLDYPVELPGFSIDEDSKTYTLDLYGKKIKYTQTGQTTLDLDSIEGQYTEAELVRKLDQQVRQQDITQSDMIGFLSRLVSHLINERKFTLTALYRGRFPLANAIEARIKLLRSKAANNGYQDSLFGDDSQVLTSPDFMYEFKPGYYPAKPPYYSGRYLFQKHFFDRIEDLKADGEEFNCACVIDSLPEVKHWVRNLVKQPHAAFWLPLAEGKFYPDFVVELNDGRMLVVEYKGENLKTSDDSREKDAVGQLWARTSNGQCLFLMAVKEDDQGRDVTQQIRNVISL
ncbi:restriction endonuclease subunit R [Endozoicomonas montiporae]|uniref:Restriction endonuclease subunit R n=2 Tax=Endozoicomonas montiporae TaxID=1027273 RepID=A0A081N3D0_9GAMM|nr:DEAD/DEAH box helicase family protein [Endozoicomonas montiporae]AMO58251.1 type III restriction endonuclease subunit R [Endozoicomonas montiporae CL-33]KEQ12953.1 restriction endonuclease subunit R [Endozoicomonas montiporae]